MEKLSLQELQPLIINWAKEKGLINKEIAPKQRLKLLEEIGEAAKAILNNDIDEIKDGIGDIFVVLVILSEQLNQDIALDFTGFSDDSKWELFDLFNEILRNQKNYFSISYLNDICTKLNFDLLECSNLAWNEIKDRKGKLIDGTFIKENK